MRRTPFLVALVATAALAVPAAAGEVKLKSQWDGFGEGSWVLYKTTAKSVMGDQPANENVMDGRSTLTKVTEKSYTVKTEQKVGEEWSGLDMEIPRFGADPAAQPTDAKVEDLGTEKVTVDGEALTCKKQKVTLADTVTISWTHEKHGQVKLESKGPGGESTFEIVKLKAVVKVKGKDVECVQSATKMKSPQSESTTVMYVSDAVPGGSVRVESEMKMPGVMTSTSVMEVTDFEKK